MKLAMVTVSLGVVLGVLGVLVTSNVAEAATAKSPSPSPFACAKDQNGKCSQLLIDTDTCVAISLPVVPNAKGTCRVQINDANGNKVWSSGVSNDPKTGGAVVNYLRGWLGLLNGAIALIVMLMIVVAGIQYVTSLANPSSVAAAKKRLTNAILALVMWLMMFAVLQFLIPGGIL
jgi:hypothetical protein